MSSPHTMTALTGPLAFITLLLSITGLQAQDTLFYTNGNVVAGQVEEIVGELVRYRGSSSMKSVVVHAKKQRLWKVKLADGREFAFADEGPSAECMSRDQCLSIDVLAPAMNHITVGYERPLRARTNLVVRIGYIGLVDRGNYSTTTARPRNKGALAKAGIKFMLAPPNAGLPKPYGRHPLAGWYIRPDLLFSGWEQDEAVLRSNARPERSTYLKAAMNLTVGRQAIISNCITFDLYCGAGYGLQWYNGRLASHSGDYYREQYAFTHVYTGYRAPLTFSGGLTLGVLF